MRRLGGRWIRRRCAITALASTLTACAPAAGVGCADSDTAPPPTDSPTPDAVGQLARTSDAMCWLPGNGDPLRCWLTIDPEALSSDTDDVDWEGTNSRIDDVPEIQGGTVFVPPRYLAYIGHIDVEGTLRFYQPGPRGTAETGAWLTALETATSGRDHTYGEAVNEASGWLLHDSGMCSTFSLLSASTAPCEGTAAVQLRSLFDSFSGSWGIAEDGTPVYWQERPPEFNYLPTDGPRFKEAPINGGCAITVDDDVVCYPRVPYGDPTLDLPDEHYVPPEVDEPHGMHENTRFGCLLDADGRIHCWGEGYAAVKEAWANPPQGTGFQRVYAFANGVICGVKDGGATCTGPGVTPELLAGLPPIGGSGR